MVKDEDVVYRDDLSWWTVFLYCSLMLSLILVFGKLRKYRNDSKKGTKKSAVQEMMDSLGLHNISDHHVSQMMGNFSFKEIRLETPPPEMPEIQVHPENRPTSVERVQSYFHWLYELWQIDLDECRKYCGLDTYIYLRFLRDSCAFFLFVTIASNGMLLPTYLLGETNEATLTDSMDRLTLMNALG